MKIVFVFVVVVSFFLEGKDYTKNLNAIQCMNTLINKHGFKRDELNKLFSDIKVQNEALRAFLSPEKKAKIKGPKETRSRAQIRRAKQINVKYGSWGRYSRLKINAKRVNQGVAFIKKYKDTFKAVEKKYGVPKEYIAAIIGVETVYGGNVGKYPIFDTLATLGFEENRRSDFFRKEFIHFMALSKTENFNPKNVKGSHAGAIGLGQFLPSNYKAYGVDFNKDGKITLQKAEDAIASIANYLKKNGWRKGELVAIRAFFQGKRFDKYETGYKHFYHQFTLLGTMPIGFWDYKDKVCLIKLERKKYDELWYGTKNFYVITRYNHSDYYAMSVHQLAQKIKKRLNEN